jgi:hypothetical protein
VALREFEVTEEHLKLLRSAWVGWDDCEFGAPAIDPKRPYGNSDVIADIGKILGVRPNVRDSWGDDVFSEETEDRLRRLHKETQTVLQIALATGRFEAGVYAVPDFSNAWAKK